MFNFSLLNTRSLITSFEESEKEPKVRRKRLLVGALHTIFHVVRRFAQNILPSYRVYAVKIWGVTNEFSPAPVIAKSTVDVLKNLSQLDFSPRIGVCSHFLTKLSMQE